MEQSLTNMLKDELRLSEEEAQEKQQRSGGATWVQKGAIAPFIFFLKYFLYYDINIIIWGGFDTRKVESCCLLIF